MVIDGAGAPSEDPLANKPTTTHKGQPVPGLSLLGFLDYG